MSLAKGVCRYCDEPFTYEARGTPTLYCSPKHRQKARVQRQREANAALEERWCPRGRHMAASTEFAGPTAPYCRPHMAEWARDGRAQQERTTAQIRNMNLRRYGLTLEQFEARLAEQDGKCAICGTTEPGPRGWHVDHDHTCCAGKKTCGQCIRGILCASCNWGIGNLKDDPEIIRAALDYVLAYRTRREAEGHINPILQEDAAVTA